MTRTPLLLGYRYSTYLLPLDLSDDQLMTEEPELDRSRADWIPMDGTL